MDKNDLIKELNRDWNSIKNKAYSLGITQKKSIHTINRAKDVSILNTTDIDRNKKEDISYIIGVIDGDGWCSKSNRWSTYQIGLETKHKPFANKFFKKLVKIGLNPMFKKLSNDNWLICVTSKSLGELYIRIDREKYLSNNNLIWRYLDGMYDSEGHLHKKRYPMICTTSEEIKSILVKLLNKVNIYPNIHYKHGNVDKVYIPAKYADDFLSNIISVYSKNYR